MSERKSRMMPEAFDELVRRANAGEDISGPFDLKTGRPAPMQSSMRGAQIHGDASMTIPQTNTELVEAAKPSYAEMHRAADMIETFGRIEHAARIRRQAEELRTALQSNPDNIQEGGK